MIPITVAQAAAILNASVENAPADVTLITAVGTDSRQALVNGLFFALSGERFDGHAYLDTLQDQGYVAAVVERFDASVSLPQIVVENSKLALGRLAQWLKNQVHPRTLAITGSSGKTTVKEMSAAILRAKAERLGNLPNSVLATQGNLNNDLGVPLTLLRLTPNTFDAVVELGANHAGEIAYTTQLVRPNVAIVNNVASAHLAGFGSLQGVANAKGEIFQGLTANGIAVVNAQSNDLAQWKNAIGEREIWLFGDQNFAENSSVQGYPFFTAKNKRFTDTGSEFVLCCPQGEIAIHLPFLGEHNIQNALASACATVALGANLHDVQAGLSEKMAVKGRLFAETLCPHLTVIDDSYNANVASMQAAIAVLSARDGTKFLVLGDMAELGELSRDCHKQVGESAQKAQLNGVFTLGEHSQVIAKQCGAQGRYFLDKNALQQALCVAVKQVLAQGEEVSVLVKGSRSMGMEAIVEKMKEVFQC